jgi:hypothetical protein
LGAAAAVTSAQPAHASAGPIVSCDYTNGPSAGSLGRTDDTDSGPLPLPFPINFYGITYGTGSDPTHLVYVNNNGNVTLGAPEDLYIPLEPQSTIPPTIAPFDADVDTRGSGSGTVHYGTTTFNGHTAFCVLWGDNNGTGPGVGYYYKGTDKLNIFQMLLVNRSDRAAGDFDVVFNYKKIQWENGKTDDNTQTGGSEGCGGTETASAGFSAGDGIAADVYRLAGSAVSGSFLDPTSTCPAGVAMRHGLASGSYSDTPNDPNRATGRFIFNIKNGAPLRPNITLGTVPTVVEGDTGVRTYHVPVTFATTSPAVVSFTYSVFQQKGDTAVQDVDFVAVKRSTVTVPVRADYGGFTATTHLLPFQVYSNTTHQGNRTFTIQIDSAVGAMIVGPPATKVTILDDDPSTSRHVDVNGTIIEEGNQVATVGGANKADLEVTLSTPLPKNTTATVDVSLVPGTATPGVDYRPLPNGTYKETLTFTGGQLQQPVQYPGVGIVADTCLDGDKTYQVVLSNPHGITLGPQSSSTVTIRDKYDGDTLAGC